MGRPGSGRSGRPKPPKIPKKASEKPTAPSVTSAKSSSAGDTHTDATSIDERKRKTALRTNNRYTVNDTPLSDFEDDVMSTQGGNEVILRRPGTQPKKQKMPPIVVVDRNVCELRTLLTKTVLSNKYIIKSMSVGTRVDIVDVDEHMATKVALKEANIDFYTYHSPSTKPLKFILHGLQEMDVVELRKLLLEANITPEDIKSLNIKRKR